MSILDVYEKKPKRNHFNLSHSRKYTMQDFGVLYPILCKELMPGDVFKHSHEHFMQFMPMASTVLHRFRVQTYYFFVPNRLIWGDFDDFINMDPNKFQNPPIHPYFYAADMFNGINTSPYFPNMYLSNGSLADYLGYRTWNYDGGAYRINGSRPLAWDANNTKINALPFRAYQKIWFDYFRDEESNASNTENPSVTGGNALEEKVVCLRSKAWGKDPFTTALKSTTPHGYVPSINGSFNLEDLRNLKSQTTFFEKIMRAGSGRPQEFIHAVFGVKPKDYRLDMPEFLNASSSTIVLGNVYNSEASQLSQSGTLNRDQLAQGFTVSTARSSSIAGGFKYRAFEFGWLIGLACIVPDSVYFEGLPVELRDRVNNLDYPFPDFARTGDQAILNSEVMFEQEASSTQRDLNNSVFGFGPRYWQYKRYTNSLHGMFRSTDFLTYHDARLIPYTPSRNQNFVYIANEDGTGRVNHVQSTGNWYYPNDPSKLKRIFNIVDAPLGNLIPPIAIGDIFHNISALRPLPFSSIPRL